MSTSRSSIARTAVGIACIAAALCALAWFVLQFAPGEPRAHVPDAETGRSMASNDSRFAAEDIVDVAAGEILHVESLTQGKGFAYGEEDIASWSDEERERVMSSDSWRSELPQVDFVTVGFKAMTDDAFIEWYPHYGDARIEFGDAEAKVLLVELSVTNPNDEPIRVPAPTLWSDELNGASDMLGNGIHADKYLLGELYGTPHDEFVAYEVPEDWNMVAPGETRTLTYPYLVYENTFSDPAAYDDVDPSRFCLEFADYDPPTIYRLWLG